MSRDQILGLLRHALTTLGGFLVAEGRLSPEEVETLVGAALALAGVFLSWWVKRQARPRASE